MSEITEGCWTDYNEWHGRKTRLENVDFIKENGRYYLDLTYIVDTMSEKFKLHIPRVRLCIREDSIQVLYAPNSRNPTERCRVNIGGGTTSSMIVDLDENGRYLTETVLEKITHEMTIAEIEEKLGYRIKIVGE